MVRKSNHYIMEKPLPLLVMVMVMITCYKKFQKIVMVMITRYKKSIIFHYLTFFFINIEVQKYLLF